MKRIVLFCAVLALLFCSASAQAALTYGATYYRDRIVMSGTGYGDDPIYLFMNEVEAEIEASTLEGGTTLTFSTNGGTFDNVTNNTFRFGELSEYLTLTFSENATAWTSSTGVVLMDFGTVVPKTDQVLFDLVTDAVGTTEGTVYYDSDDDNLYVRTSAGWTDLTAGAGTVTDMDTAYNGGSAVTVDTDAITLTTPDTSNNVTLAIVQNEATADNSALTITFGAGATGTGILINSQALGTDIAGDNWSVSQAGALIAVSGDLNGAAGLTLQNDGTILNDVDTEIQLADGAEDISFGFGVANTLTMTTDTGVDTIAWGDLDAWTGIESVAFDSAPGTMTLTADGAADDFTISVAGAFDASLVLASSGTGADALQVTASAGGIDISSQNDIDITTTGASGEDITLTNSGGSIILEATEAATDAIVIKATTALGGIDITSNEDIDITTTGASGEDITISNAGGQLILRANENANDVITIDTTGGGGSTEAIVVQNDQGTAATAIGLTSTAGGITLTSNNTTSAWTHTANGASDDLTISVAGNTDSSLVLTTAGSGTDALQVTTTANGGDIVINSNDKIDMDSTGTFALNTAGDTLLIQIDADGAADDLTIQTSGAQDVHLVLASSGTSEDAVQLTASAGGINITANGAAANEDIDIATTASINLSSTENIADAIKLLTNSGTTETITITNTQGNTATSVGINALAGGITLNGAVGGVVFTAGQTRKVLIPVEDVDLDGANPPTLTTNGTNAQWIAPSLEFDADGGATGDDLCFIHWVVPDGYKTDSARLNVYWSHDTAEDAADECNMDFAVNAAAVGETLDAAGTAGVAVTTVIADASASAGKLQKTQINIEVEDIVIGDMVSIMFWFDENVCQMSASGTADVHYFEIEWESTE